MGVNSKASDGEHTVVQYLLLSSVPVLILI